jgi:hypothetical protein
MSTDLTRVGGIACVRSPTSGVLGVVVGKTEELGGEAVEGEETIIG